VPEPAPLPPGDEHGLHVELRLRALVDAIPDLVFRITADGTYLDFAGDPGLLANPVDEVVGGHVDTLLPPDVATALMATIRRALDTGTLQTVEYVMPTMSGVEREFETRVVPIDENEVVTIARDATDFRQQERDLRIAHERLVQARDAERRRLERNLHDGAQQRLVVSLQALRVAMARLPDRNGPAQELLVRAEQQLALAIEEVREIARGLHPAALTEGGLAPALQLLADRLEGLLPVELDVPRERFDPELEACAYYLVAEALANASKYADAPSAAVRIVARVDSIVIDVADEGRGAAGVTPGGGLEGLFERVSALGGTLTVESPAGEGTRLHAELPLPLHVS
jgi:signal transduction histidine kinase